MADFTHIVNPVNVSENSDLHFAQPITFASIRNALEFSKNKVSVEICTTQYPEDHAVIPDFCRRLPDLTRSVATVKTFQAPRKLPLMADILQMAYDHSDSPYLIYTNMDIGLMPHFYEAVHQALKNGADALVINRRRLERKYFSTEQLPEIYSDYGRMHPGFDCFVFKREWVKKFRMANVCVGIPFIEISMYHNLMALSASLKLLEREHLTFHIGQEVMPPVHRELYLHNRREFEQHILPELKPLLRPDQYPYQNLPPLKRLFKYGLSPNFRFKTALEMEGKDLGRKIKFYWNEIRFYLMDKVRSSE